MQLLLIIIIITIQHLLKIREILYEIGIKNPHTMEVFNVLRSSNYLKYAPSAWV